MPFYLKQYGERRTGTNALRALIAANCEDTVVLMHILGDKHSAPVDLDALWREVQDGEDAQWQFIQRATHQSLSLTTNVNDVQQATEMRRHAAALATAFASGAFGYIVSIRNPYAWAVSISRFLRWPPAEATERLREECVRFNEHYRAWLELFGSPRRPALLVRHEDLLCDAEAVLDRVSNTFAVPRLPYQPIDCIARPVHWDDRPAPVSRQVFDRERYLRDEHLRVLNAEQRQVVTETMDWEMLRGFGYEPMGSSS